MYGGLSGLPAYWFTGILKGAGGGIGAFSTLGTTGATPFVGTSGEAGLDVEAAGAASAALAFTLDLEALGAALVGAVFAVESAFLSGAFFPLASLATLRAGADFTACFLLSSIGSDFFDFSSTAGGGVGGLGRTNVNIRSEMRILDLHR